VWWQLNVAAVGFTDKRRGRLCLEVLVK
jgi:hypothetical protein